MHVLCLRRRSVYLFIHLSLVPLWVCATPLRVVVCWFSFLGALLCVGMVLGSCVFVLPFVHRAFKLVEGSYFARVSQTWVHPAMAAALRVTQPPRLVGFIVLCSLSPPSALGHGHHGLVNGALPTRT
jgi:O-antigen ligase